MNFFMQFKFNILWVTLTQKIITHRVLTIHDWFWGDVYEWGEKFLKPWQVTDKIIEWICMQFTFNILWVTLTQKIIPHRVLKIHKWISRGCVWVGAKFLKPWQVTDNIIEWICMQFTFNILRVTLTQKIITRKGCQKFMNGFEGMCMSGGKSPKSWQVTDKIIEWIFIPIHIHHFMSDSNSE